MESSSDAIDGEEGDLSEESSDDEPPQLALPNGQFQSKDGTILDERPQPQVQSLGHNIFAEHPGEMGRALLF